MECEPIRIEWGPSDGRRRRALFDPQRDGEWLRTQEVRSEDGWVTVERETVHDVELECPPSTDGTGVETCQGP
ncbi:hypothetical protein [Natronococcus sp.]|uniref:hypothetical protein n=1 Tax=Natronococcus sp. TaxID=35747 RepID=UPI003A4E5B22